MDVSSAWIAIEGWLFGVPWQLWTSMNTVVLHWEALTVARLSWACPKTIKNMAMALAMDGTCPQFDCDPLLGVGSDPLLMVLLVIPYWVMFGTAHDPSNPEPGEQVERWWIARDPWDFQFCGWPENPPETSTLDSSWWKTWVFRFSVDFPEINS